MKQRGPWLLAFLLAACGPKAEPAAPAAAAEPPPTTSTEPAPPAATSEPPVAAEPAPSSSAAVAAPSGPSIHELCFGMCDRLKDKCGKNAWESCRLNCGKYDPPADGCGDVVRSALTCAKDAADLVCANVAPESCSKQFRQINACASGQKPSEAAPAATALPTGFVLWTNAADGMSAPLPEGYAAGSEPGIVVTARYGNGAVYSVRKLPRPPGKLNEKVFLKVAMDLFGRCTDKMKMQGMVDKPGRTSINYSMRCPDGASERGLFWATDKTLFVASARGPSFEELGPTDAFLYGFEAK